MVLKLKFNFFLSFSSASHNRLVYYLIYVCVGSLDPSGVARSTSYQQGQVGQTIASPLQPAASSMAHNQQQRLLNYHGGTPYHNHGGLTANSHGNGFIASDGPRAPVQVSWIVLYCVPAAISHYSKSFYYKYVVPLHYTLQP